MLRNRPAILRPRWACRKATSYRCRIRATSARRRSASPTPPSSPVAVASSRALRSSASAFASTPFEPGLGPAHPSQRKEGLIPHPLRGLDCLVIGLECLGKATFDPMDQRETVTRLGDAQPVALYPVDLERAAIEAHRQGALALQVDQRPVPAVQVAPAQGGPCRTDRRAGTRGALCGTPVPAVLRRATVQRPGPNGRELIFEV